MAYTKQTWEDGVTLINATRLNHIEQGVYDAQQQRYNRGHSIVVAASDASAGSKAGADLVCDGSDDGVVINQALNTIGPFGTATGGTVMLTEGTFDISSGISSTVQVPSYCSLIGRGLSTILRASNSRPYQSPIVTNSLIPSEFITIANLVLDGNKSNQSQIELPLIYLTEATQVIIKNVVAHDGKSTHGIEVKSSNPAHNVWGDIHISDCTCYGGDGNGGGIRVEGYWGVIVSNCACRNNAGYGIELKDTSLSTVTGCTVSNNANSGIRVATGCEHNTISGNSCYTNAYNHIECRGSATVIRGNTVYGSASYSGIGIYGANYCNVTGNVVNGCTGNGIETNDNPAMYNNISGNSCMANTLNGIALSNVSVAASQSYNTITSNTCYANGRNGIYLTNGEYCLVEGNICAGNSQGSSGTYHNIMVDNNMDYLSIIGCKCYKGTAAAKPGYGIRINNANNDYVAVFDCDLQDGGTTGAYSDAGTSTNKQGGR